MSALRNHRLGGVVAVIVLAGCASGTVAPVVDRSVDDAAPRNVDLRDRGVGVDAADAVLEYRVVRGDTLYAIAFRHGLDFRALAARNGIAEPYTIYPGQVLRLRDAPPASLREAPPARAVPVAREGDTEVYAAGDGQPAVSDGQLTLEPVEPLAPVSVPSAVANAPAASAASPARTTAAASTTATAEPGPLSSVVMADAAQPPAAAAARVGASPTARSPPLVARTTEPSNAMSPPAPATNRAEAPATNSVTAAGTSAPAFSQSIVPGPSRTVAGIVWRWPTAGTLIGRYAAGDPARQGIDIAGSEGQAVLAAAAGEVVYSGNGLIGYGELIIIKHSNELLSAYGHNRRRLVAEGQRVAAGQLIAEMGRSGGQLSQLHFEIRRAGRPVDPLDYLPPR